MLCYAMLMYGTRMHAEENAEWEFNEFACLFVCIYVGKWRLEIFVNNADFSKMSGYMRFY